MIISTYASMGWRETAMPNLDGLSLNPTPDPMTSLYLYGTNDEVDLHDYTMLERSLRNYPEDVSDLLSETAIQLGQLQLAIQL